MISTPITPQQNAGVTIGNATIPPEGPKCIPLRLDFTNTTLFSVDPLALYQQQTLSLIQGVWVDNSENASPVTISISATQQNIIVSPGDQGFYPLLSPKSGDIQFYSVGGVLVIATLYNVPLPASQWQGGNAPENSYAVGGALKTQDVGLAQIIDPVQGLKVQGGGGSSGLPDNWVFCGAYPGIDGGPGTIRQFGDTDTVHVTNIRLGLSPDAHIAAGAGIVTAQVQTAYGAVVYGQAKVFIPGAVPDLTAPAGPIWLIDYHNEAGTVVPYDTLRVAIGAYNLPALDTGNWLLQMSGTVVSPP